MNIFDIQVLNDNPMDTAFNRETFIDIFDEQRDITSTNSMYIIYLLDAILVFLLIRHSMILLISII